MPFGKVFSKYKISRRRLAGNALVLAAVSTIPVYLHHKFKPNPPQVNVLRPGMEIGHQIRNRGGFPEPVRTWHCDLLIAGSGAAALTAAWKLKREGATNFVLLEGPEPNGNNAGIVNGELSYPTAAHYLAMPTVESRHIREMLADIGVLQGDPYVLEPQYDEMVVVHAQEERLLHNGVWQEGMLPQADDDSRRFFELIAQLSEAVGEDGKPLFAIPIVFSSQSSKLRELDEITFAQWLEGEGYTSSSLLWYLNYCCRDDYGQGIKRISAWAGLHYFACRTGHAKFAEKGAVLTWPDGLATLSNKLREYVGFEWHTVLSPPDCENMQNPAAMAGTLLKAIEHNEHVELLVAVLEDGELQTVRVITQKLICAIPVNMASRVVDDIAQYGFNTALHTPQYAPWMISSFVLNAFPSEIKGEGSPLSWDNVVQAGPGLGYVVSTHQLIRAAKPERTAFTTYYALDEMEPHLSRRWMDKASDEELLIKAASDLQLAYPKDLWQFVEQVDITLRGHGMASPTPYYLSNDGLKALQQNDTRILFAHSDLSGYSVLEEAAWWGYQAALKCLV